MLFEKQVIGKGKVQYVIYQRRINNRVGRIMRREAIVEQADMKDNSKVNHQ